MKMASLIKGLQLPDASPAMQPVGTLVFNCKTAIQFEKCRKWQVPFGQPTDLRPPAILGETGGDGPSSHEVEIDAYRCMDSHWIPMCFQRKGVLQTRVAQ